MSETKPLVITRVLDAPVEKVWAAWTEPEQIKKWWGPKDFTAPTIRVDLQVGGKYLFCMHGQPGPGMPAMDFWSGGTYDEIVPLKRLVCLDSFADADGNMVPASTYGMTDLPDVMRVQVDFEPLPDGKTKLTLTHDGAPAGEQMSNMETGWNQSLDKLAESVR
ncbi:MAG TPA: SRPBCC domain-containing protein [Candidatus Saccharimonadales bacterium]|nr:SRPBCC domain-containing protein [Candidatus Saccharimonadales bacterium]